MRHLRITMFVALLVLLSIDLSAQRRRHFGGRSSGASNAWVFGLHWNFVHNDNQRFDNLFSFNKHHGHPFPSKLTVEKYLTTDFSAEIAYSNNRISEGKQFEDDIRTTQSSFHSMDVNFKYRFIRFFIVPGLDPYLLLGGGVSRIRGNQATINLGGGFNTWLANGWGLNFQFVPKLDPFGDQSGQYFNYSFGFVYRYFVSDIGARRLSRQQNILGGNTPYRR